LNYVIYPENFEHKLGFDKIRELVAAQCLSSLGREQVEAIRFSADATVVAEELEQTGEFVRILQGERAFPANYFIDVRPTLSRIRPEGTFADELELFDLKRSLQTIVDITRFFRPVDKSDDTHPEYPVLAAMAVNCLELVAHCAKMRFQRPSHVVNSDVSVPLVSVPPLAMVLASVSPNQMMRQSIFFNPRSIRGSRISLVKSMSVMSPIAVP